MSTTANPLELELFKEIGFIRKKCENCSMYFWTSSQQRKTCGDPPCDSYTFIKNSPVNRKYTLDEMRESFLGFFRKDHTELKPYPVVPRWRDDVLLVNASIYDFQPQVTSGVVKPPANPIVMSQPSIRMVDIDLVGTTGRHLTTFEMMCHDSFNYPGNQIYWKEETVRYCHNFLTQELGIEGHLVTYKEKPWSGGGNGGNAFEVLVNGLEVATLVFMDKKADPDGDTIIDGLAYSPMEMQIVDTGYGLERLTWLSQGTPTVYQAIYPDIVEHVLRNSDANLIDHRVLELTVQNFARYEDKSESEILRLILPKLAELDSGMSEEEFTRDFHTLRSAFVIADHARTLLLLFSDYVIPSNIKAGYLVRLLIRRSLRSMEQIHYKGDIGSLIEMHWDSLKNIVSHYPREFAEKMLDAEAEKYSETLKKGVGIVKRLLSRQSSLSLDDLAKLYDSSGLHPDFVASVVKEETGRDMSIPDDFHKQVVSLHDTHAASVRKQQKFPEIKTRPLYYDDVSIMDFNALVLHSGDGFIITNQTAFYPEGGGQPTDLGYFVYRGKKIEVEKVVKIGDTIVHWINGEIPEGSRIMGHVDKFRRSRLMVHHTATHLILGVMKEVLGPHVWQFGVQKGVDSSRIDITHYRKLCQEDIARIEQRCLDYIREGRAVRVKNVDWNKAIEKYGFTLFQGGVPLSPKLRIVEIEGVDVEGCGGTHVANIHELGFLKIVSAESIQEGIQRINFVAGDAALSYLQTLYSTSRSVQSLLAVDINEVPERLEALKKENISLKKEKDDLLKEKINEAMNSATVIEYSWGSAAFLTCTMDNLGMNLLTKALFSKPYKISLVRNELSSGRYSYTLLTKGKFNSLELMKKIVGPDSEISGKGNYLTANSSHLLNEKLIRGIFDETKP